MTTNDETEVARLRQYLADRRRTIEVLTHRAETAESERTALEGVVEGLQAALRRIAYHESQDDEVAEEMRQIARRSVD